jgi:hypothetical protein
MENIVLKGFVLIENEGVYFHYEDNKIKLVFLNDFKLDTDEPINNLIGIILESKQYEADEFAQDWKLPECLSCVCWLTRLYRCQGRAI